MGDIIKIMDPANPGAHAGLPSKPIDRHRT